MQITTEQVLAFRLCRQSLAARAPSTALSRIAGGCGVQDTPPGAAALSLHARMTGVGAATLRRALFDQRSIVKVWSVRQAPYVVPAEDLAVFTLGLLPEDESSTLAFIQGAARHLVELGLTAVETADLTADALLEVLDGRDLTKDDLGAELAERVGRLVTGRQAARWDEPDQYGRYGVTVTRFALGIAALRGLVVFGAPREDGKDTLVRTDRWLGAVPTGDRAELRAELLRRYLRCYGPSTPRHFAEWGGISLDQARSTWALLAGQTAPIRFAGSSAEMLAEDVDELVSAEMPGGARLLPAHDPYLQARDRATMVADARRQRLLWRSAGSPGALIFEGRVAGTWSPHRKGSRLEVVVRPFDTLPKRAREPIEIEAAMLGPLRGAKTVFVSYEGG